MFIIYMKLEGCGGGDVFAFPPGKSVHQTEKPENEAKILKKVFTDGSKSENEKFLAIKAFMTVT